MRHSRCLFFAALLLATAPTWGDSTRDRLLIEPAQLQAALTDPRLVLLHIGERAAYDTSHIPGARYVDYSDGISVSDHSGKGLMLEMLSAEELRGRLSALGISDDSRVVVYYGQNWVSPATRMIFTLDYAGLDDVALLNGGMGAWTAAGFPVTAEVPVPKAGKLSPLTIRPIVVDAAFVREHLGKSGFRSRRCAQRDALRRHQTGGAHDVPHKTGHVAGAGSVPYGAVTGEDLKLKPAPELEALFAKAGVKSTDTVIAYCHIGQQATATLFAARTLGRRVLLYDGSFEDWSRRDGAVEVPTKAAAAPVP